MAWASGDRPGALVFVHAPPPHVTAFIAAHLGLGQISLAALAPVDGPVGRYRLMTGEGDRFLRVSARLGAPAMEKDLTDWLVGQNVPVNPILAVSTADWQGETLRLDQRPFLAGRHFNGASDDLVSLGTTLAHCHQALATFPQAGQVRLAAEGWNRNIDRARLRLAAGDFTGLPAQWAARRREWLLKAGANLRPDWHCRAGAQVVHGEVHVANVMFDAAGTAVLVDFEESVHAFAPPVWDMVYGVQRFCLADDPDPAGLRQRLSQFAQGYGALPKLGPAMREAAWYVIAQIAHLGGRGIETPESECEKFVRLEGQGAMLEDLDG